MHFLQRILEALALLLALGGAAYYALALWASRRWLQEREVVSGFTPPVSILKPLKGTDPSMYEAFRSHCVQDYPEYEIVFGVADVQDPAAIEVQRLQKEFPDKQIRLVLCSPEAGMNRKVATLQAMLPRAKYEHLLINDSDIRVERDYLRQVMNPMAHPQVGMVTALYRAGAGHTLWSKLEALGIATDFMGGVLTAREIEGGLHFGLGSTLALPRKVLDKMSGLAPLLDHLADDYQLGANIAAASYDVVLARTVVETHLPDYSREAFWTHQLRWGRTIRDERKGGYVGLIFTFGLPWALLLVLVSLGAWWSWLVLLIVAGLRFGLAWTLARHVLHDAASVRNLWLVPLRDVIAVAVWVAAFAGDEIVWRGERFHLHDGKLTPIPPA